MHRTGNTLVVDMILFCPKCGAQHIDKPDEVDTRARAMNGCGSCSGSGQFCNYPDCCPAVWTNPPHRSHLCHSCNHIWRPSDVHTNGVAEITSKGVRDSWPAIRGAVGR